MRVEQARSDDLANISHYYSQRLVSYIRAVLQCVPDNVFRLLQRIVDIQTNEMGDCELPAKIDKESLPSYAHLQERYEVSKLTHAISVLTDGLLAMKSTLIGIIRIEPRQVRAHTLSDSMSVCVRRCSMTAYGVNW